MSIDRLNAEDGLMLEADEQWPQDVGALALLDGSGLFDDASTFRIDAVRAQLEPRLRFVPRFRQVVYRPRRGLGGPLWLDDPFFDLGHHIKVVQLPSAADEAGLLHEAERLRRPRLDPARPLWEMWFLTGLPEHRVGLLVRFHHVIADGRAALTMLAAFLDIVPDAASEPKTSWTPVPCPSVGALMVDNLTRRAHGLAHAISMLFRPRVMYTGIRSMLTTARELIGEGPAPNTSLNRLVGPERTFALVRASLATVKQVGHNSSATTNDVLLALTAGGLRALLLSRGERVDGLTVRIYVPVSLRRRLRGTVEGNLISQMVIHLPLGERDPERRLRQIAAETERRKELVRPSLGAVFRFAIVRKRLIRLLGQQRVNSCGTTVHGPKRRLYLLGAEVLEIFPLLNLFGNENLGIGALTYAGAFNIGVVGDRDTYPDLAVFTAGVQAELVALQRSIRPQLIESVPSPVAAQVEAG